jgi:predicted transcriptional regulator/transcriptional regulator with XRE-family HTH domain
MRAPIGLRIATKRRAIGQSQAGLARAVGISASYLNLIERNKREVGGTLLKRIAEGLDLPLDELTGEGEQRLINALEEAFADPVLANSGLGGNRARELVASAPDAAAAIVALHRAYQGAMASADAYANRLRADPLFSELLHQILSGITAVRSGAEILGDVPDLGEEERQRFVGSIRRETVGLSAVAQTLIGQFDSSSETRRTLSPVRELDDLIAQEANHFPSLELAGVEVRAEIDALGPFGEASLKTALRQRFGVEVTTSGAREVDAQGFPGQYRYDPDRRSMWFQTSANAATRQFQLARLYAELARPEVIDALLSSPLLSSPDARRLAQRALGSYLAGTVVLPYEAVLAEAEALRYDIAALQQRFGASFEQVAHRLVTLRRKGAEGIAFGFLRSDPAGRLTKHFPLPGLLLPSAGHACPLWAIYAAFRAGEGVVRQVVRFPDGSRYLFIARATARRAARFGDNPTPTSVMLACNVLQADGTVYADGLDLGSTASDVPVGPACRLCTRRDCASRQEEVLSAGGGREAVRAPLVPRPPAAD